MKSNSLRNITVSALAPSLRRLRSGTSSARPRGHNEVLPHDYGTYKKDPFYRTAEGLLSESHTDRRTPAAPAQSGCIRHAGVDREQFSAAPGVARVCRAATLLMGCYHAVSVRRAGDCMRQSLGAQEEAGVALWVE
jgi:hypothetical protein